MAEIAVHGLMENLKQLINGKIDLILEEKDQIESLYEELGLLRFFLEHLERKFHEHEELKNLETRIRDVAYEAENTIDLFVVNASMKTKNKDVDCSLNLDPVKQEIGAIKTKVEDIWDKNIYNMRAIQVGNSSNGDSSRANIPTWEDETMVGFDKEALILKEQLTGGTKQLQVVSIVGMAGLGKTTLAINLYNDPLVVYHFHIRAWIYVSQEYQKKDLLLRLLRSIFQHEDGIDQMSEEKLAEKLYKCLKGRLYFIVMDDIWDSSNWDDLKIYFPNDNNGSRILFTSRLESVALHANPSSPPLPLRFLSHDESWDLLQQKIFRRETCPRDLMDIGKQIAKKCRGLPLAIVVVAGILANEEKTQKQWKQIGETVNTWMGGDQQLWIKTIELSYNHLPRHLKACFLYFGAFPEDFQIPVRKLIWLWVAEGFIRKTEGKTLEDVAEEYLMDLIGRSLVLVSIRRFDGGIKACGIHDLLHDFCLKKAEEEHFLKKISHCHRFSSFPSTSEHFSSMRRLCIHPAISRNSFLSSPVLNTRSFLCIASAYIPFFKMFFDSKFLFQCFKLLRVLDISSIQLLRYPSEIEQLVLLRYLAFGTLGYTIHLPESISNLWNLETLILVRYSSSESLSLLKCTNRKGLSVTLPQCIRKMVNLRHFHVTGIAAFEIEKQEGPHARYPFSLDNLQTLSWVDPWSWRDFLATPNLRTLGLRGHMVDGGCLIFPDLNFLHRLQKLKLFCKNPGGFGMFSLPNNLGSFKFPPNLKKLTLVRTNLNWAEMSTLGKLLPNLESLKLLYRACIGDRWETSEGVFPRLKFLKFVGLDIAWWNASSNHLPSLQRLVLLDCVELKNIPSEIGYIPTLQMIEIHRCNPSIANSAWEIKEEQESMGNDSLQIIAPKFLEELPMFMLFDFLEKMGETTGV